MYTNEMLWILLLVISYLGVILIYRFFGRAGLYAWVAMSVILANIQVVKTISLFGFVTAEGNIIYSSIYLVTDILNENYGKKEAKKAVWIGFFILIMATITMQIVLQFIPDQSDTLGGALGQVFGILPRIALASIIAYLISQFLEVSLYAKLKEKMKGRQLWLRNNITSVIAQTIDNIIFTWIAFVGFFGLFGWGQIFEWPIIISIFFTTIIMKYIVSFFDTFVIYMARKIKPKATSS
ncbi:queuosine precursor transporter [Candidatus Woesearchaeota archaeon]|nr:queuosine precursor transporter [Candidatus Woesearchaeota archaeon]